MAILTSALVPKNSGAAFEVKKGQRLRIAGKSIVDFVAFNLARFNRTLRSGADEDQSGENLHQHGRRALLETEQSNVDNCRRHFHRGRHDLQKGMCSRKRFEMVAQGKSRRVFAEGVDINPKSAGRDSRPWLLGESQRRRRSRGKFYPTTCPARSIFFNACASIADTGIMYDTMIRPKDEAHVDFRAEMDLLVAASACPESGRGQAIRSRDL